MKITNVGTVEDQKSPNFKALKGIKFIDELQINPKAQNELLKIFDHEPIKDIFTKFDGNVEFKPVVVDLRRLASVAHNADELSKVYKIECHLNLFNCHLTNLLEKFKEQAKKFGVNIDKDLNSYAEKIKTTNFEFERGRYDRLENYDIKKVLDEKEHCDDNINEATHKIKQLEDGSLVLPEWDSRDKGYWNETIEEAKFRLKELMPEIEFYNENKKDWNNVFYITAKMLVSSVLKMSPEEVNKKIPETVKLQDVVEQDLDNILQDAICEKNVKTKLKELLGENYIEPKEQIKTDIPKKYGVNIEELIHKPQEVEEKGVNKGKKSRKPKIKKDDIE